MWWNEEREEPADDPIPELDLSYVGVDGGATRSRAVVLDREGEMVSRTEGPPAYLIPDRLDEVVDAVARLVDAALGKRAIPAPPEVLCAGLAGAGRGAELREEVARRMTRAAVARHVMVVTDVEVAYHDAFGGRRGALLLAGTGSVAWGVDARGRRVRAGGWGTALGDEGSGYHLALDGLRALLYAHDGRGEETRLTGRLLEHLALDRPEEIVDWAHYASKAEIAALAPIVITLADGGDPVASALLDRCAGHLERHVAAVLRALESDRDPAEEVAVAFGGGLLRPSGSLRRRLETAVRELGGRPLEREVDPARGAARMARDTASGSD